MYNLSLPNISSVFIGMNRVCAHVCLRFANKVAAKLGIITLSFFSVSYSRVAPVWVQGLARVGSYYTIPGVRVF